MIRFIISMAVLLIFAGCGGSSEPPKQKHNPSPPSEVIEEPATVPEKTTRSVHGFTIYTMSNVKSEADATTGINNFNLLIDRDSKRVFDSKVDNLNFSVISNQDSSITIRSKEALIIGDILTLNANGFIPQQQKIDQAMLEANSIRISLKSIGSRQVFELGELNSGRVTTRFAMGASTKISGEDVIFKTNDNSVMLSIKKTEIDRMAKRVSRSTKAKADKNTKIYLDITTIDPKTELESAIGDFTYKPSIEPKSGRVTKSTNPNDTMLESVVMSSISMTTSGGEEINCFDGSDYDENSGECEGSSSATLKMKIPSSQFEQYADKYNKGERTIPLYYYSKTEATWIRQVKDGEAIDGELILEDLNTNNIADKGDTLYLSGSVGHFSYWNGDMPREVTYLSGTVKVQNGAKLPSGTVVVSVGSDYSGRSFRVPVTSTLTYANLGGKSNAKVELYLEYPDGTKSESIFVQTLSGDKLVSEELICNYQIQDVTLTIKDLSGNVLNGVTVKSPSGSSSTDSNGKVVIAIAKEGSTKVTASYDTGSFITTSSKFVSQSDKTIVLDIRSFKIAGEISFINQDGEVIDFDQGYVEVTDQERSLYSKIDVENGKYELLLPFNKFQDGKTVNLKAGIFVPLYAKFIEQDISVTISDTNMQAKNKNQNFQFELQPFIVSGKVSNPFAQSGQNGIANITIYSESQSVQSDENGNYQMVLFYKEGGQTLKAYDPINGDIVRPTVINIAENEQDQDHSGKNFVVDRRSANIEGSVVNEKGIPVQGVLIYTEYGWLSTVTDAQGKFSFEINNASMMGQTDIKLKVYDANDNTKLLGSKSVEGEIQRGTTIDAGEILISTNIAPIIRSVNWDEPILGQSMNIYVDAYDPDNNALKTTVTFDGSDIPVSQGVATITPQDAGRLEFVTKVEETDGDLSAQIVQSMIVSQNAKPTISSITGFSKYFEKVSNMVVTIDALDPEGATLNYRAKLSKHGQEVDLVSVSGNSVTIQNSIENGDYHLVIYISDGIDEIERNFRFVANDNVAPQNLTISKASETIDEKFYVKTSDSEFNLIANATDANGDALTYTWNLNEALGIVSGNTLSIDPVGKVGVFPISVSVTDGSVYISKEIILIIENDLKPIIETISLNPQTITKVGNELQDAQGNAITKLTVEVLAIDPEGTALSYNFGEIVSNLTTSGFGEENNRTYNISHLDIGRHALKVDVKDENGKTTSQRVLFKILENKPPRISTFFVPIKAKAGTEISLNALAIDPEEADVTYVWSATHNQTALTVTNAQNKDASMTIDSGVSGEIAIKLEVSDGKNIVKRERTIQIVQNNAPVINQFRVLPTILKVGKSIQYSTLASDPDFDDVSYAWYWNDEQISTQNNGVHQTDIAGASILKLVVSDGELTKEQSETITVEELIATPIVTLQAQKSQILATLEVEITATVNVASRLKWSVSDGGVIFPKTAGATFSAQNPGTYTISVTATNEDGVQGEISTIEIEVKSVALELTSENAIQVIGSEFKIDAALSDEGFTIPSNALWQISTRADGSVATLQVDGSSATITPDLSGTYTISLSFEIDGVSFNAQQSIVVRDEQQINEADTVHGVVTDASGEILAGAKVRLYNAEDLSLYDATVITDETGGYIFSNLQSGRYYLVVSGGNGFINQTQVIIIN